MESFDASKIHLKTSGGMMGTNILVMYGENYLGHFYPDATNQKELDGFYKHLNEVE